MCEETQAYSCRETELGRPSYREAPLGRGWRAGQAATLEGCARRDLPPQAPPGARVPFRRNRTAEEKTCENSDIWGFSTSRPRLPLGQECPSGGTKPRKKRPARILTSGVP